jgi:hypothetical protein
MKFNKKWLWLIIPILIFSLVCLNTSSVSTVLLAIQGAITDGNLVKFSGANGVGVDTGLSATNVVKCKFDATSAPTVDNDVDEEYTVGSRWLDITNLKSYVCLDNTDGAAVWIENVVEGDMNKSTYDTDEDGDIDVAAGGTEKSSWTLYCIPYLSGTTAFGEIPIGTEGQVLKVSAGATGYEFATESDPTVDTQGEIEAILTYALDDMAGDGDTNKLWSADKIYDQLTLKITDTANAIDSDHYTDGSIDHEHLAPDVISGLVDVTSEDVDYILIWDATDSTLKKCDMAEVRGMGNGYTNLTEFVDQTAWRLFYSNADGDVIELPLGADGTFLGSNGVAVAPSFGTPTGAGDMLKAIYDTDEDNIVDKSETVDDGVGNSSTAADVKDAVAEKHSQNTDTALGIQTQDLNMGTHKIIGVVDPVNPQEAATKAYADTKIATEVDPTVDSDEELKAILVDEITKTGTLNVGNLTKTNDATGVIEDAGVATETTLTVDSDTKVPTSKAVNDFCETTKNYAKSTMDEDIDLNEFNIFIDTNLISDHTYSGIVDNETVGEDVVFGDLLYFYFGPKAWKKADADLAANMPGLRIALEDRTGGQLCKMLVMGYVRDNDWDFTGSIVYASATAGGVTSTAPSGAGQQLQRVGVAKTEDILFFDPSNDVGEIKP